MGKVDLRKMTCEPLHALAVLTWLAVLSVSGDDLSVIQASINENDFDADTLTGALGIQLSNCETVAAVDELVYDIDGLSSALLRGVTMETEVEISDFDNAMSSIMNDVNECFMANMETLSNKEDGSFNLDSCAICLNA